jgi:hypothetical protein
MIRAHDKEVWGVVVTDLATRFVGVLNFKAGWLRMKSRRGLLGVRFTKQVVIL